MGPSTDASWVVVVPVKRADVAKSRLSGVTPGQRVELARAFPADCAAAAIACDRVGAVVVVTDDTVAAATVQGLGATVIPDTPDAGLNAALEHARSYVRDRFGDRPVVVLSGDLPSLRPEELSRALALAQGSARAFLSDHAGEGTTLLAAAPGTDLDPRFGTASRRRHLDSGADELDPEGLQSVRRDVDTWSDLEDAVHLGVGRHTQEVLRRHQLDAVIRGQCRSGH
jgi:2-phospho-L-lactate/phosphoenolpyruvate guanylyltransferase